jgi:DNA-directed RNA polymerase I subunit RPA1
VIGVTPTNTRPINIIAGLAIEHPQNSIYKSILNNCLMLRCIIEMMKGEGGREELSISTERKEIIASLRGTNLAEKLQNVWLELQTDVDTLLDAESNRSRNFTGIGIKQVIEKKAGVIRMNMMGKYSSIVFLIPLYQTYSK